MRRLVAWIAGALVLTAALGSCGIGPGLRKLVGDDDEPKPTSTVTPATFGQPLQLRPVTEVAPAPCASGMVGDVEGTQCYRLAEETISIERVKDIKSGVTKGSPEFAVMLTLYPEDAKAFGDLTGRLAKEQSPRNQVAVVVDGKVVSAPAVMEAIPGGEIQIAGNFTQQSARELVERIRR
ncbi:SecDF P1 head subdomain-containing protein [Flindersiella endophytica]